MSVIQSISNHFDGTTIIYLVSILPFFESVKHSINRRIFIKTTSCFCEDFDRRWWGGGGARPKEGHGQVYILFLELLITKAYAGAEEMNSLSDALLSLFWSTWPRSARSFLSLSSCASTRSRSRLSRSCSAATCWWRASCCFRNLSRCSLAASSCRCESICCCWRPAISSNSLSVSSAPSRSCNNNNRHVSTQQQQW